jgi:hypothetical protein
MSPHAFLLSVTLFVLAVKPVAAESANCNFVLGFGALHDAIPNVIGDCVNDETHNPINGDALQATTNGSLVWRKADNVSAFTNGSQSWLDGPFGIQMRPNDQRFTWEPNPDNLQIVPTPVAGDQCHTAGLSLSLLSEEAGAGNVVGTFLFTNQLGVDCTFFGFPGAQLLDSDGNPLPTKVVRNGGPFVRQAPSQTIDVPAGGAAEFEMHWVQVPVNDEANCQVSSSLAVTPPDEYYPLVIPIQIRACDGGRLDVGHVEQAMPSALS